MYLLKLKLLKRFVFSANRMNFSYQKYDSNAGSSN